MRLFGLIGYPLTHSFSKKYFTEKFQKEGIKDAAYELFEIKEASEVKSIIAAHPDLNGLNVTIPHKEAVIPFLDALDPAAEKIGAVNVIRIRNGKTTGFNSDFYGFKSSLEKFLPEDYSNFKALVLGTGGAAKAVKAALDNLKIPYLTVSRTKGARLITYDQLDKSMIDEYKLIVNTSPLGMYPKTESFPEIPYQYISSGHYLFDLVYNPENTTFMKKGTEKGARTKNGLEMLYLQAEKAWEIWDQGATR
ncbi:MAG: shikimate dehydrogenase family protein [Cytophagaceae bacterium]